MIKIFAAMIAAFVMFSGIAHAQEACVETMDQHLILEADLAKKAGYKFEFVDEVSLKGDGETSWKKFSEILNVMKPSRWKYDRVIYMTATTSESTNHVIFISENGCYRGYAFFPIEFIKILFPQKI